MVQERGSRGFEAGAQGNGDVVVVGFAGNRCGVGKGGGRPSFGILRWGILGGVGVGGGEVPLVMVGAGFRDRGRWSIGHVEAVGGIRSLRRGLPRQGP